MSEDPLVTGRFVVPYLRVSTDDKDQLPERQLLIIKPWAEREGLLLLKPALDVGTSASKTPALKRAAFIEACERAVAAGAEAVVFEKVDRFSRLTPKAAVWEMVEVERRYGLKLHFASHTLEFQETLMGQLAVFMELTMSHKFSVDLGERVASGVALRKRMGVKFGRKPKLLREGEEEQIQAWLDEGKGWPTIANLVKEARGVVHMTSAEARKRNGISESTLKRLWRARRAEVQNSDSSKSEAETMTTNKGGA